ncbi:medium-chain fatty acid ethyl ester synthase/esterase 1 [Pyronema omphalodes]|nr:medium-chain fatty acid ethyl ester synthase/esterase 1 [Pyronema omphalodes]
MRFLTSPTANLHHATTTITLLTSTASNGAATKEFANKSGNKQSLSDFCTPLIPPFYANPLLFNSHLQTFWTTSKIFGDPFTIHYNRLSLQNPRDHGHFALDVVVPAFPDSEAGNDLPPRTRYMTESESESFTSNDSKPMIIALHGLSGGSHEVYLRAALFDLLKNPGWEACVVNARGCAKSKITTKQLFNARWTSDIRATVEFIRKKFPNRPLYAIGFSLGGNILTNYLGEEGENCQLKAAVVVSNPWQLELSCKALHRTWIGKEVYSKVMGANLRRLFEANLDMLKDDPRIDAEKILAGTYLLEFDRDLTAKVFGYKTVGAYYRDASSVDNLLKVKVPTLVLHAEDDPIAPGEVIPYDEVKANPYVFMATTQTGGHLSWFEWGGGRWFAKPISAFLDKFAKEVRGVEEPMEVTEALEKSEKQPAFEEADDE